MPATIKFDNTEIRDTTHVPRFVKHESVAERQIITLPLAREDGEVLITSSYGIKKILLQGILTGTSQANLEAAIDTFKELFSRIEKNLDVDWNGTTLRFVATCSRHDFDRDHFHNLFVPWTAEFTVMTGTGKDTAETVALNESPLDITSPVADVITLAGTKPSKPRITIKGNSWPAAAKGIEYKNTDTGEKIVMTKDVTWGSTYQIIIDCLNKTVKTDMASVLDPVETIFYGMFPQFKVGTNNILLTVGGIVNQETSENGNFSNYGSWPTMDADTTYVAQSFSVPYSDTTFQGVTWVIKKIGTPGVFTWRVETDNGGKPSGTLANANATGTIAAAAFSTSFGYINVYSTTKWPLTANTKYWLVITAAGLSAGNEYAWGILPNIPSLYKQYQRGYYSRSTNSGGTWTASLNTSLGFKIKYGGVPGAGAVKHTVEYTKNYL